VVSLKSRDLAASKQIVFQPTDGAPILIALPAVSKPTDETDDPAGKLSISMLDSTKAATVFAVTGSKGSHFDQATFLMPPDLKPLRQADTYVWFSLPADRISSLRQLVIARPNRAPDVIAVPDVSKADESKSKAKLTSDQTGVGVGNLGPYVIKGTNLKLISAIRYLGKPLPIRHDSDGTSVTIDALPATLTANPGIVDLDVEFFDGTQQQFSVPVKAAKS